MVQKHRISTNIGQDQKLTVELKQDYDLLEILSLKFTQQQAYTSLCADYGVVCGRISVNNGFGIPNARVSIFVPLNNVDVDDPVISALYPYTDITVKSDVNNNFRYNLLPSRKQHSGHTPTGTFFDQEDIVTREEVLQVYETYYSFTVKTNESGDFMIWGVPVGQQTLHVDVDLSDIGCQSLVPYDFIYEGESAEKFQNGYTYMASNNLDNLPQIKSFDSPVTVYPFWGNEDFCEIGISRKDFDLGEKGVRLEPYAILMGGTAKDSGKDAISTSCNVNTEMGEKCTLTTTKGNIEGIRFTGEYEKDNNGNPIYTKPILESVMFDSVIDENGTFFFRVPMNTHYLTTDEFGEIIISKNKEQGIPTKGTYRFRFSLGDDTGARNVHLAQYLVPNIREYHIGDNSFVGDYGTINPKSYAFSTNIDDYPDEAIEEITGLNQELISENQFGVPQDYFYQYRYGRVYSVSQFINKYEKQSTLDSLFSFIARKRNEHFIGIKEIWPIDKDCPNTNNYFPINDAVRIHKFAFFIAIIISYVDFIGKWLSLFIKEFVAAVLFAIAELLGSTGVSNRAAAKMFKRAKEYQFKSIFKLSVLFYPDCYDCAEDNTNNEITITTKPINIPAIVYDQNNQKNPSLVSNFYMGEKYTTTRPLGTCDKYTFTNSTAGGLTVGYTDCDLKIQILSLLPGETISVCGKPNQTIVSNGATYTVLQDGCDGPNGYNPDDDLYFIPSDGTHTGFVPPNLPPINQGPQKDGAYLYQQYVIEVDAYGAGSTYLAIGLGQSLPIIYDEKTSEWKIKNLYGTIANEISSAYNTPFDEPQPGTSHTEQGYVLIKNIWLVDDNITPAEYNLTEVESGCSKYDFIIEDSQNRTGDMNLYGIAPPISSQYETYPTYYSAVTFYDTHRPNSTSNIFTGKVTPYPDFYPQSDSNKIPMWDQLDPNYKDKILGIGQYDPGDCNPINYDIWGVASINAKFPTSDRQDFTNEDCRCIRDGVYRGQVKKKGPYYVDQDLTKDGTLTGWSEFRDGVYTIVPLAGKTGELLSSYRRRKLFGKIMCGGATSYVFTNSWLNGLLYFFQYQRRGTDSFCHDCVYKKVESDGRLNYYYRSTPYNSGFTYNFEQQSTQDLTNDYFSKTKGFYGSRRGITNSNVLTQKWFGNLIQNIGGNFYKREINFPTTVVDLGPRQTWINEICFDPELDVNCSISRSIGSTSYRNMTDLIEYVMLSKELKSRGRLDVQDLFDQRGFGLIDGDVAQLMNFNTQTGIYPFETDEPNSPYYQQYSESFDSKGPIGIDFVYSEDDPTTPEIEYNGFKIRECLNQPGRLGDNSQKVPYFMWDTQGYGFGESTNSLGESQSYFTGIVYNQRLQQMKANLNNFNNIPQAEQEYTNPEALYVIPPIRDCLEVNGVKQKSNTNYNYYTVGGQTRYVIEIGYPFHYIFGLRKGKTAFDKFIEHYGPK